MLLTEKLLFKISASCRVNMVTPNRETSLTEANRVTVKIHPTTTTNSFSSSIAAVYSPRMYAATSDSARAIELKSAGESHSRVGLAYAMASSDIDQPVLNDDRIRRISYAIRVIPDWPKPGIMFHDITTLLLDPKAFKDTIDLFVERYRDKDISVVAGIEARGFIFGPPIALAIGAKFVPMRKPKKLPGEVISEEYSLEYGTDIMEMHVGAVQAGDCALIVDDLIATGGTLGAAIRLLERVGVTVVECACVIEIPELKGRERLGEKPLFILVNGST